MNVPRRLGSVCVGLLLFAGAARSAEAAAEGVPCTAEPSVMSIVYGDLITCAIDVVGDTDVFRFSGSAGENPVIQVTNTGTWPDAIRPCVDLIAPDSSLTRSCAVAQANRIDVVLTQTGTYSIVVEDGNHLAAGTYVLALERVNIPSPSAQQILYGETLSRAIDPNGDLDEFVFSGKAGETVRVNVANQAPVQDGLHPCIEVTGPDNTRHVACPVDVTNGFSSEIDVTLTQNGLYTILIDDFPQLSMAALRGPNSAPYALSLQCLVGPCNATGSPSFSLTLTGCTACHAGNPFTVQANLSNPGPATQVEFKLGLRLPDGTAASLLGASGQHLVLSLAAGMNTPFTLLDILWPAGVPTGTWTFEGTLLEVPLGKTFSRDVKTFQVLP